MRFDITPYIDMSPAEVRQRIRKGEITFPTAGMCRGYAQANLVILPPEYAADFEEYTRRNPFPCPVLEIIRGTPETHAMGEGGDITTDIPEYFIYRNGVLSEKVNDASAFWKEGYVGFLIGCSFSFEEALMAAGIEVRHIATGRNVPMYKTGIRTVKVGPFEGPMVCSMRPMTPETAGPMRSRFSAQTFTARLCIWATLRFWACVILTSLNTANRWKSARGRFRYSGPAA